MKRRMVEEDVYIPSASEIKRFIENYREFTDDVGDYKGGKARKEKIGTFHTTKNGNWCVKPITKLK